MSAAPITAIAPRHPDCFANRHIAVTPADQLAMVQEAGFASVEALIDATIPAAIRRPPLNLPDAAGEHQALAELQRIADRNQHRRWLIGMGYHGTRMPPVLRRAVLENPGWYTQYTPYQAEISQGRLEALLTFQTMVSDLTALPIANASLLDEATAAAEAMHVMLAAGDRHSVVIDARCHPQVIAVVRTRAAALGVQLSVQTAPTADATTAGMILAYPRSDGSLVDPRATITQAHAAGALVCLCTDLLALTLIIPPGELGADLAVGSAQRFGVPLGFGGPHAAFFSCSDALKRLIPGRLVGVSKDRHGTPALRLALQTREQHIRREKATSNICTAQALLANLAAFYAVWHGPEGLTAIAKRVHALTCSLAEGLRSAGFTIVGGDFDTLTVATGTRTRQLLAAADAAGFALRQVDDQHLGIALDETIEDAELIALADCFGTRLSFATQSAVPAALRRSSAFLTHPVFHQHRSEHALLRFVKYLENKDLSLAHGMIPLGSCTMKLNATAEMLPITWEGFAGQHPYGDMRLNSGWSHLFIQLEQWLGEIAGLPGVSLQPNAGSQGEYAGLLAIRSFQKASGQGHRSICLIPVSAHGTNPASAVMAGLTVVAVACDTAGNIDITDLTAKANIHRDQLCCLMVTYPSTHGVFEAGIRTITGIIHDYGGQVYLDGANMNAQVGLTSPGAVGADVCHLNLHKTFCIPHGGGGPGVGPICVAAHLIPHVPGDPLANEHFAVSAARWGSAGILPIPWMYIRMMGGDGLTAATRHAIVAANYVASRLTDHYPILYTGRDGTVAHECIIDLRPLKALSGVDAEDVAKRLMDYGFHAPTLGFPVPGTLMIEPTESEPRDELDRFITALISIRAEIQAVIDGTSDRLDNPLKQAPHTQSEVTSDTWTHGYSRQIAAFPAVWCRTKKFWPSVARVDNTHGDRNLICSCAGMDAYR